MIRFACPGCSSTFSVDDSKAGKSGKCPKCGAAFIIPSPEPEAASPPPPPPPQSPASDPNAPVEIDPCPKCQTKLSVAASDLGNDVECPYCKTIFASARAGTRPPAPPPPAPGRKSGADLDFSGKPKSRRAAEDDDDDDRPRRRRRDDDDDDEDERPSRRNRRSAARRDDDDDEDDRPSRRRKSARRYDDEDDEDDYRPRRRSRSRRGGSGERSGAVTAASVMTIVVGVLWLIGAGLVFFGSAFLFNMIGDIPGGFRGNPRARGDVQGAIVGMAMCCGVPCLLMSILHILGGIFAVQRKAAGRILVIICASIALILGLFALYGMLRIFMLGFPPFGILLYQFLNLTLTLGYGTFAMIVMCRSDYADEFE